MQKSTTTKIHKGLAEGIVLCVYYTFSENLKADKVIEQILRSNKKWGSRDRAFIAENAYEIIRWWRLLHHLNDTPSLPHEPYIIWHLLEIWLTLKGHDIPTWEEFKQIKAHVLKTKLSQIQQHRAIRESIPDWLDERAAAEIGEDLWEKEIKAMNKLAPVYLRVNTNKSNRDAVQAALKIAGIHAKTIQGQPQTLMLTERKNVFSTDIFKAGHFEVQDLGSQMIATFLDPKPGQRIIDACAGAGGKTLHIANLMENKGRIIAMDIYDFKLKELNKRAKRNDIHNIETRLIAGKVIKRLHHTADKVLLDVPCSGTGVLKRNPDAKWKLSPEYIDELIQMQKKILWDYSKMVKVGGELVYATCSLLASENQNQVTGFLEEHPNFQMVSEQRISPATLQSDGFYMAKMTRVE